jgi:hypothetical protein
MMICEILFGENELRLEHDSQPYCGVLQKVQQEIKNISDVNPTKKNIE